MREYRTRDGDTLDAIAWRVYGRHGAVVALAEANPQVLATPVLPVGMTLQLPDVPAAPHVATVRLWGAA
ncbi:MAG: tail protein X [Xanthomonadaceae bacterium]|nr:tail protein X [Xanthomonadaceae bacterium]